MNRDLLINELRLDEGEKLRAYKDSLGYWTVGVGQLIDPAKGGNPAPFGVDLRAGGEITRTQSAQLLDQHLVALVAELDKRMPWWVKLSENRQRVVANMAFQLGVDGLLAFKKALAAMRNGAWQTAADQMLDSEWAAQTPARAKRLAARMVTG